MASKKRTPRTLVTTPSWEFVLFTDLHVSSKTLDRALRLLQDVRALARSRAIFDVVCLGDFWDQRGILSVRHLDALMNEFDQWKHEGLKLTMIPGNHDQVTTNGLVHGARAFAAYDNITVATEPIVDASRGLAFLPWREDEEEQSKLFSSLPPGMTIFAHAEIQGATTNEKHLAPGRVSLEETERHRAVYAGHYHKRQKLGSRAWYIGSPFEMNFGERNQPHGIAIVRSTEIEPEFIDLHEYPKHLRFTWPDDASRASESREQDITEVMASADQLRDPVFLSFLESVRGDVRPLPLPKTSQEDRKAPAAALSLRQAVETYAAEFAPAEKREALQRLGLEILAQVPDTAAINPMAKKVDFVSVTIRDFMAIRGSATLPLDALGAVLLKGRMGVGKSSLFDAISWCLYGATSPRKSGAAKSQLRADEVIHEDSEDCEVTVTLRLDDAHVASIRRSKKRGKGATLNLQLPKKMSFPTGISDAQSQVDALVGLDHDLFRTCVYLGQGAVANFVTDADKKRKELLSRAFSLGACTPAVKLIRKEMKDKGIALQAIAIEHATIASKVEGLKSTDFTAESSAWEEKREAFIRSSTQQIHDLKMSVEECDRRLASEPEWLRAKTQIEEFIRTKQSELMRISVPTEKAGKLHQEMGRVRTEKGNLQGQINTITNRHRKIRASSSSGSPVCDECGQPIDVPTQENILAGLEIQLRSLDSTMKTLDVEYANLQTQLGALSEGASSEATSIQASIHDAQSKLTKCNEGINALARFRANRDAAVEQWNRLLKEIEAKQHEANPFASRMAAKESQLREAQDALSLVEARMHAAREDLEAWAWWEEGFGPKGVPVLVLRMAMHELESYANHFAAKLTDGKLFVALDLTDDDISIDFFEMTDDGPRPRSYLALSGGQNRCVELAFVPFALSEVIFNRVGVRVSLLLIDELTTHLAPEVKPLVCHVLPELGRETVLVIDHDQGVQGEFDKVMSVERTATEFRITREKR